VRRLWVAWKLLNLPCQDVSELISRALDGELHASERFAVGLHLLYCKACRRFRRQVQTIKTAMAQFSSDAPLAAAAGVPALTPEARERIDRAIREANQPSPQ
jgi:predicted anti-sigma-YlaC factor YlaD